MRAYALLFALCLTGCAGTSEARQVTQEMTSSPATRPLSLQATDALAPSLAPSSDTASRQPVRLSAHPDAGLKNDDASLIHLVYSTYLTDLSGLLDVLTKDWLTAIAEVATEKMTTAAGGAAAAVRAAHDHGVGTLVDSHRVLTMIGSTASLTDCLDEKSWYVVENKTSQPDPSVTRAYFVGAATFVKANGQWKVSSWNSHTQRCTF